jgi:hypothetical protein
MVGISPPWVKAAEVNVSAMINSSFREGSASLSFRGREAPEESLRVRAVADP